MDSVNFSLKGYFPLIQKDSVTHMHGLCNLCEGGTSFCKGLISRKFSGFLFIFRQALLRSVYFISLTSVDHLLRLYA